MGLKYYSEFTDVHENLYKVEILNDSYNLPKKWMELGAEPVVISRPSKSITEPIFSMGATLQVWCNENFEYKDLFSTGEHTNRVVIGCNGKVIFHGWIEPNMYEEEFVTPPYLISIPAADGLAALEDYIPNGLDSRGLVSLLTIIRRCLECTGLHLPINIACGLNPDDRTDNRLFEHTYVEKDTLRTFNNGVYEYDDAKKLLEDVLKPFSCRVYQSGGEWYIERIKDRVEASVEWIRYDGDIGKLVIRNDTVGLDSSRYPFVDNAATLQIDAGYGRQTAKADGDRWETVITNNFDEGVTQLEGTASYPFYPFNGEQKKWYKYGSGTSVTPYSDKEIKQGLKITHKSNASNDDRIWQVTKITANNEDEIEISFKLTIEPGPDEAKKGLYAIGIQSKIAYRDKSHNLRLEWKKGNSDETRYSANIDGDYICRVRYEKDNDWKEGFGIPVKVSFTVKLEDLNKSIDIGYLSLAFFPVEANPGKGDWPVSPNYVKSTIIGDIEVKVREKREYDNTFSGTINRQYMRKADDLDIRFWTLPSKYSGWNAANYNYKNGLMKYKNGVEGNDYEAVVGIRCPAEDYKLMNIAERLLLDNFDQYYDPRNLLSGTVMSDGYLSPDMHYSVETLPEEISPLPGTIGELRKKAFLMTGLEASLRDALYDIELEEIKPHQITANFI